MRIPKEEVEKFNNFSMQLHKLWEYHAGLNLAGKYKERFTNIVLGASAKLVGCNDVFVLRERSHHNYYSDGWALTRDGIREQFGWNDKTKLRRPTSCNGVWIEFIKYPEVLTTLKAIRNRTQIPEGVDRLVDLLTKLIKLAQFQHADHNLFFNYLVQLPNLGFNKDCILSELSYQASLDHQVSTLLIAFQSTYRATEIILKNKSTEVLFQTHGSSIRFTDWLPLSEEPLYSTLMKHMQIAQEKVEVFIQTHEAGYKQIIDEYGQYEMLAQL